MTSIFDQDLPRNEANFAPREAGAYRAQVVVTAADGSEVGQRETGWSVEPEPEEFKTLTVNRPLLAQIANQTGGEVLTTDGLESFVSSLPNRKDIETATTVKLEVDVGVLRAAEEARFDALTAAADWDGTTRGSGPCATGARRMDPGRSPVLRRSGRPRCGCGR